MKIINNYPLFHSAAPDVPPVFRFTLQLPEGAEVLRIVNRWGEFYAVVLEDPTEPDDSRTFEYCQAGHRLSDMPRAYINTFDIGDVEYHAFELH